ncbi:hypothetical protein EDD17DRAFT_1595822 [Pisolithus thermaeus]|nr:hypothetical protein EV401DRAFT_1985253 [Pisolithus croceorrhizus]KAI6160765.1 hypothetical protein EDD17DRAFT_1595822 [Pisolithus thermaeus]
MTIPKKTAADAKRDGFNLFFVLDLDISSLLCPIVNSLCALFLWVISRLFAVEVDRDLPSKSVRVCDMFDAPNSRNNHSFRFVTILPSTSMRAAVAFVALSAALSSVSAGLVSRQSLPSCANPCITNANLGGCSATDDTCLCENQTFINSTTTCIESSCTGNDLQEAEQYAQSLCLAVGVTLTIATPTPTSTSPTSSSSSSST